MADIEKFPPQGDLPIEPDNSVRIDPSPTEEKGFFEITWGLEKWAKLRDALEESAPNIHWQNQEAITLWVDRLTRIVSNHPEAIFSIKETVDQTHQGLTPALDEIVRDSLSEDLDIVKDFWSEMDRQITETDPFFQRVVANAKASDDPMDQEVFINLTQRKPWER